MNAVCLFIMHSINLINIDGLGLFSIGYLGFHEKIFNWGVYNFFKKFSMDYQVTEGYCA